MRFTQADWTVDKQGCWAKFLVPNESEAKKLVAEINQSDKPHEIEIKEVKKKRSLDANAYFWVLCGKLAAKTRQNKTDIYRYLIQEIGDNFVIIPLRNDAVDTFVKNWKARGLGWICEVLGDSKLDGYTTVCAYYGSSTYDNRQMSNLIDSIVFECKEQGIETKTPQELAQLKDLWARKDG